MKQASGNKRAFTKTILTYGKDVNMSFRKQTTEVLLRWNYVRQAVGRALYTLEQLTVSEAKIFRSFFQYKMRSCILSAYFILFYCRLYV